MFTKNELKYLNSRIGFQKKIFYPLLFLLTIPSFFPLYLLISGDTNFHFESFILFILGSMTLLVTGMFFIFRIPLPHPKDCLELEGIITKSQIFTRRSYHTVFHFHDTVIELPSHWEDELIDHYMDRTVKVRAYKFEQYWFNKKWKFVKFYILSINELSLDREIEKELFLSNSQFKLLHIPLVIILFFSILFTTFKKQKFDQVKFFLPTVLSREKLVGDLYYIQKHVEDLPSFVSFSNSQVITIDNQTFIVSINPSIQEKLKENNLYLQRRYNVLYSLLLKDWKNSNDIYISQSDFSFLSENKFISEFIAELKTLNPVERNILPIVLRIQLTYDSIQKMNIIRDKNIISHLPSKILNDFFLEEVRIFESTMRNSLEYLRMEKSIEAEVFSEYISIPILFPEDILSDPFEKDLHKWNLFYQNLLTTDNTVKAFVYKKEDKIFAIDTELAESFIQDAIQAKLSLRTSFIICMISLILELILIIYSIVVWKKNQKISKRIKRELYGNIF